MPHNFIFLGVEFLVAKCKTNACSEDSADQWYRFKYTSTRSSHSWMRNIICGPTQTLTILLNYMVATASTARSCTLGRKVRNPNPHGRTCLDIPTMTRRIPLALYRLSCMSWFVVALLLMEEETKWHTLTTASEGDGGVEFFLVGVIDRRVVVHGLLSLRGIGPMRSYQIIKLQNVGNERGVYSSQSLLPCCIPDFTGRKGTTWLSRLSRSEFVRIVSSAMYSHKWKRFATLTWSCITGWVFLLLHYGFSQFSSAHITI